jgi:hypothetical protein
VVKVEDGVHLWVIVKKGPLVSLKRVTEENFHHENSISGKNIRK